MDFQVFIKHINALMDILINCILLIMIILQQINRILGYIYTTYSVGTKIF